MKEPLKRITIKTVAEHAGVSPATVSLVLSERPGWVEQFHPDTVKKVRAAAEKLGYRRNIFASAMPAGSTAFFALVLREMTPAGAESWQHWGFEGALLEGVNAGAEQHGVHPIVVTAPADPSDADVTKIANVIEGGVFGSIVRTPGAVLEDLLWARLQLGHPIVVVFPTEMTAWPSNIIDVDNVAVGQIAGKLLAARKRRQWMLVRFQQMSEAHKLRVDGFTQAARQAGVRPATLRLPMGIDEHEAAVLIARQLERVSVDGIFAVDSVASVGSILGGMRAGLTPGDDYDVIGCDASLWRTPGLPRITSIDISWREVGMLAIEKLFKAAQTREPSFKNVLLKPRIVEGDSCLVPAKFHPDQHENPPAPAELQLRPHLEGE
ncbi:MAG TPA: LacI family DNA-binding transcriptional regulator [Phycisphaerae bacterium]|mgnify:CR=1 FL=1|nr:LacI family DNA-binding transcriptional regulator [Phycisphaerae bacterium]HPU26175.1 LacI family DNA-binding transcriptional regulator [Phycisphaerae bacterium]HQE30178.1 LacI family DNA-binding transcriptional regulator [Phycisphaerae bacterium]